MNNYTQAIEDEAGEPFGISYDQVQADYHRLHELGVNDGTGAALMKAGVITHTEWFEELDRTHAIDDTPGILADNPYWDPYRKGYESAYANTMTPEILACFAGGTWSERHDS